EMRQGLLSLLEDAAEAVRRLVPTDVHHRLPADEVIDAMCLWPQFAWTASRSPHGLNGRAVTPWDAFLPGEWVAAVSLPHAWPVWERFGEAGRLAADLDTFLFVLERHTPALARDCRADLDLLGVLADWCEDAGLPRAAAEARYHAERVREWLRGPG